MKKGDLSDFQIGKILGVWKSLCFWLCSVHKTWQDFISIEDELVNNRDCQPLRKIVSKQANLNIDLEDTVFTKTNHRDLHRANIHERAVIYRTWITDTDATLWKRCCCDQKPSLQKRRNCWIKLLLLFLCAQKICGWTTDVTWTILMLSLLPFWALNVVVVLLSMGGSESSRI